MECKRCGFESVHDSDFVIDHRGYHCWDCVEKCLSCEEYHPIDEGSICKECLENLPGTLEELFSRIKRIENALRGI